MNKSIVNKFTNKIKKITSTKYYFSYYHYFLIAILILSGCDQKKINIKDYTDERSLDEVVHEYMSLRFLDMYYENGNLYEIIISKDKSRFNTIFSNLTTASFILCKEDHNIYKFYNEIQAYGGEKLTKDRDELVDRFKEKLTSLKKKIEALEEGKSTKAHVKVPSIVALGLTLGKLALGDLEKREFVRLFEELILIKKKIIIYDFEMSNKLRVLFKENNEKNKDILNEQQN